MSLAAMEKWYEDAQDKLHRKLDAKCAKELIRICRSIPRLAISKIIFGNGGYAIFAPDIEVQYTEEPEESISITVDNLLAYEIDRIGVDFISDLTPKELDILRKLEDLLTFWIDATWGQDTEITY